MIESPHCVLCVYHQCFYPEEASDPVFNIREDQTGDLSSLWSRVVPDSCLIAAV